MESFDYPILRRLAVEAGLPPPAHPLLDTLKLARRLMPGLPGYGLQPLAHQIGLAERQAYRAAADVLLNADLLRHLLARLRQERELDALSETLPLVALVIAASGVPEDAENATLALAGARGAGLGQGRALLDRWRDLVCGGDDLLDRWLPAQDRPLPDEDGSWRRLTEQWRIAVDAFGRSAVDVGLHSFLAYARLAQPVDFLPTDDPVLDGDPGRAPALDRVALMTVHAAKGKEWKLVCLLGAEDDQDPPLVGRGRGGGAARPVRRDDPRSGAPADPLGRGDAGAAPPTLPLPPGPVARPNQPTPVGRSRVGASR